MCTNTKFSAATLEIKEKIDNWLKTSTKWPSDDEFESFRASSFPPPCPTFYKQNCTSQQTVKRLRSITIAVRLQQSFAEEEINAFWNRHRNRLLPLAKVSDDAVLLRESIALLKLPSKEVDKYWHAKKRTWIEMRGEGYRLGLMNCHLCKQSMVKIIGGRCTLPAHRDITAAKRRKSIKDAEARKRSKEKPTTVSCTNCKCTAVIHPQTKQIVDIAKSKRCQVHGHQNLDAKHLCFNEDGLCDACNGLAGHVIFIVALFVSN